MIEVTISGDQLRAMVANQAVQIANMQLVIDNLTGQLEAKKPVKPTKRTATKKK